MAMPEPLPELDTELHALLALQTVAGLGPRRTKALLDHFGSAAAVRRATVADLCALSHFSETLAADVVHALSRADVREEWQRIQRFGAALLHFRHPSYPEALRTIYDPPPLLYMRGRLTEADARAVAVVGSRQCSDYGRRTTERFAAGLARAGYTVVSGLARGIDGLAHRAALAAGGRTIAVLAGGLARLYPPEHAELAEQVVACGALLSEQPMNMAPRPEMFPARNRLISGLCRGVLLVEAGERSGALWTAEHAAEQGRDVFAVPGAIDSPTSAGTLRLLRDGAILVTRPEDILEQWGEVLRPGPMSEAGTRQGEPGEGAAPPRPLPLLTDLQRRVYEQLAAEPLHADEIVARADVAVAEAAHALITLEMKGLVRRLPGNRYQRR